MKAAMWKENESKHTLIEKLIEPDYRLRKRDFNSVAPNFADANVLLPRAEGIGKGRMQIRISQLLQRRYDIVRRKWTAPSRSSAERRRIEGDTVAGGCAWPG